MIHFKRLDHIQLCIPIGKEQEARKFYSEVIGLKEIPKPAVLIPNGGLWFAIGDIQLHIGVENEINRSKRHPAFEVENLEEAKKHLLGFNVPLKVEKEIPGQKRFSFTDPFGNRIELLQKY